MVGSGLRKFGEELGLKLSQGVLYGEYYGYLITLSEGLGYKMLGVNASLSQEEIQAAMGQFIQDNQDECLIQHAQVTSAVIVVTFHDRIGTMDKIRLFLPKLLQELRMRSVGGAECCCLCGQSLLGRSAAVTLVNGVAMKTDETCTQALLQDIKSSDSGTTVPKKNYGRGTLGAVLGALVGAIPWIIVYLFGFFVGWLGFLIGFCSKKGYELLGGKIGKAKVWIVVICSVLSVLLAQLVSYAIVLWQAWNDAGVVLGIFPLLSYTIELITTEPEVTGEFIYNLVLGLIFAGLGLVGIFKEMRAEVNATQTQVKTLNG